MPNTECAHTGAVFSTKLGWAGVAASDRGIVKIVLPKKSRAAVERELASAEKKARSSGTNAERRLDKAVALLKKYFSGINVRFDLPLDIASHTAFQQAVWHTAAGISFGETRSYAWIAKKIGNPKAARAVGQAMGANPVPILIP